MLKAVLSLPKHRGFSLLEVLVTLVIISVGLLGLAGLQAVGLKNNQSALLRSQATCLAYDIIDRMRANRQAALAENYNIALDATPSGSGIVSTDLIDWKTNLDQFLPDGDGSVTVTDAGVVTVQVRWNDARVTGGSATSTFQTQTAL